MSKCIVSIKLIQNTEKTRGSGSKKKSKFVGVGQSKNYLKLHLLQHRFAELIVKFDLQHINLNPN